MKKKNQGKSNEVGKKETEELQELAKVLQERGRQFGNELTEKLVQMSNDAGGMIVATIALARAMASPRRPSHASSRAATRLWW